jgi:hypothetical protein
LEYKYENVENVLAKRDFEVFRHDENGELIGVVTVPKGCKGVIESMGWSSVDNFRVSYEIRFIENDNEIEVGIYEDDMELYLEFQ